MIIRSNRGLLNDKFSFFYVAYILYFISLFMEDLAIQFDFVSKLVRYGSYAFFFISALLKYQTNKSILFMIFGFSFTLGMATFTFDVYFCAFAIILLSAYRTKPKTIFMVSFFLLTGMAIITVLLSIAGVFPNLNTANQNFDSRMSLGFYHSNVLPMVVFYLMGYRFMVKGNGIKLYELLLWLILSLGVYYICKGRNGFVGSILLILGYIFFRKRKHYTILYLASKYSTLMASVILLVLAFLQGKHNRILYQINIFLTGRLALAYHQMNSTGLHFINLMNKNSFSLYDTFVLDSGYLYLAIHYGLLFTLIYSIFQMVLTKKYKNNAIALLVFLVNTITNCIDNDLFSYNMLPFFVILVANIDFKTETRSTIAKLCLSEQKGFRITDR